jgi:hypothetical protein
LAAIYKGAAEATPVSDGDKLPSRIRDAAWRGKQQE